MFEHADLAEVAEPQDEATVRAAVLDTDYRTTSVPESTLRVAKLLLLREPSYGGSEVRISNVHDTAIERLAQRLEAEGNIYRAVMLANWCTIRQGHIPNYALYLYNADYKHTRRILEHLLLGEKLAPPYIKLVLLNMLHQGLGLGHDQLHELTSQPFYRLVPWINRMFADDHVFGWLNDKRQPIRFYGGVTNTILGFYDPLFADPAVGTEFINRAAERRYDLGGGFNTAEIERLVGCSFVSADLMTPRMADHDPELIMLDCRTSKHGRVATEAARREFFARQDRVEHLPFDVFKDSFPTDAGSYTIVSAGFLTSNLRPSSDYSAKIKGSRLGTLATSMHALARVLELVALGKSVDLFTIQRATSRVFHYKTCLLQWREGKLVRLMTTVDPRSTEWAKGSPHIAALDPDKKRYSKFIKRPPAELHQSKVTDTRAVSGGPGT
jgi:hypothetical protein